MASLRPVSPCVSLNESMAARAPCLRLHQSIHQSINESIQQSIHQSIHPSIHLYMDLFIAHVATRCVFIVQTENIGLVGIIDLFLDAWTSQNRLS